MKALIDSRDHSSVLKLYDLSLTERLLRQLWVRGIREALVCTDIRHIFKTEFENRFPMKVTFAGSLKPISDTNADWIVLDGNAIYDDRILDMMVKEASSIQVVDSQTSNHPKALRIHGSKFTGTFQNAFENISDKAKEIATIDTRTINTYIPFLRKSYVPTMRYVNENDQLREIENDLFEKTFKSGLEWIAIYGYKIPVRELTRWFARTPITPNQITAVAMFCRWISIPLLFMHHVIFGLLLVCIFIILDSLDGKLARMTFRFSEQADWIDHGSVLPTRLGWYAGLGWHFSNGNYMSPIGIATLVTFLFIILDDINWAIAKRLFKRTLFDLTDFDSRMHLFTHRRNDIFVMLLGQITGIGLESFLFVCFWVFISWLWHSARIGYSVKFLKLHKG